jgi:hypothetical protein
MLKKSKKEASKEAMNIIGKTQFGFRKARVLGRQFASRKCCVNEVWTYGNEVLYLFC